MLPQLAVYTQRYHEHFHLLFGFLALLSATAITHVSPLILLLPCLIGAYLPDVDHVLSIFTYGRRSRYSSTLRRHLYRHRFSQYVAYVRCHHKSNFAIYSHNLFSPLICTVLASLFVSSHPFLLALFLSCAYHFLFDILEDMVHFGRLNPNWYFRFSSGATPESAIASPR